MEPKISLRKFGSLNLNSDRQQIENNQLAEARNIQWDGSGVLVSRPRLIAHATSELVDGVPHTSPEVGVQYTYFLEFSDEGGGALSSEVIVSSGGKYPYLTTWHGSKSKLTQVPLSHRVTLPNRGVWFPVGTTLQLYLPNGTRLTRSSFTQTTWTPPVGVAVTPPGSFGFELFSHKDRLWGFNSAHYYGTIDQTIYYTEVANGDNWASPLGGAIFIPDENISGIQTCVSLLDKILIFKGNAIYALTTLGAPINWSLRRVATGLGSFVKGAVTYKNICYFIHSTGIWATDGTDFIRISEPLDEFFNENQVGNITGDEGPNSNRIDAFRDKLYISLLLEDETKRFFVYDIKTKAWAEWDFASIDVNEIFDVMAVETDDSYFRGVLLAVKNQNAEKPAVYRIDETEVLSYKGVDQEIYAYVKTDSGSTTTNIVLQGTHVVNDYQDKILVDRLTGESSPIVSNGTGSITLSPGFSYSPGGPGLSLLVVDETNFVSSITTKSFDFDNPGAIKRMQKLLIEMSGEGAVVTTEIDSGDAGSASKTVEILGEEDQAQIPVPANLRGQNFSITVSKSDLGLRKLKIYGIHLYASLRGRLGNQNDLPDSSN